MTEGKTKLETPAPAGRGLSAHTPAESSSVHTAPPEPLTPPGRLSLNPSELPKAFPAATSSERMQSVVEVAEGGMGIVDCALDGLLLRRFARKTMRDSVYDAPGLARRFVEEAQITSQLDHPNIVPVHDLALSVEDNRLYFTMKLVDGETLASVFTRLHAKPFSGADIERVLRMFLKVCDAVSFAHSRGVLHRDLKPENVMVGSHGQVYLMDWGVALLMPEPRAASTSAPPVSLAPPPRAEPHGTVVGTNRYMAPEQALGLIHEQGPCSDVYGLGGILYALLTGRGPNSSEPRPLDGSLKTTPPVPQPSTCAAWPSLPPGLCRIAMKALSAMPRDRYPSVEALKQEVEDFLRGGGWFETCTYEPNAVIMGEGDHAEAALIVTKGTCEVFRVVAGERQFLRRIGPGEIVGETGLLTQRPRVASVSAVDRVEVMVITKDALDRELDRSAWLRILVEALAARFRELDQERASQAPKPG